MKRFVFFILSVVNQCFRVLVFSRLEGLMDLYSQGYERSYTVSSSILNAIEPHLKDFQQLLLDPPKVKLQCTHESKNTQK